MKIFDNFVVCFYPESVLLGPVTIHLLHLPEYGTFDGEQLKCHLDSIRGRNHKHSILTEKEQESTISQSLVWEYWHIWMKVDIILNEKKKKKNSI